ncbi:MAG: hypothetical protein ABIJ47_05790 [Candidatus Bathyarchaeota archaeon]
MEKKHLAAMCALLVAFSAFMVLPPVYAEGETDDMESVTRQNGAWRPINRLRLLIYILRNGEPATVTGDTVALEGHILVMSVTGDLENIILPGKWVLGGQIIALQELYDEYMSGGEITVHTLKLELAQESKTVTVYFGYKIAAGGAVAEAVLPFNVQVP